MDILNKQEFSFIYIHLNGIEKTILKRVFYKVDLMGDLFHTTNLWALLRIFIQSETQLPLFLYP